MADSTTPTTNVSADSQSMWERINARYLSPILAIVSGVLVVFTTIHGISINNATTKLTNLSTKVDTELKQKEFSDNLKLSLFTQVKDAIEQKNKDTAIMKLTLLYVNTLLTDSTDSTYRESLKTILLSAVSGDKRQSLINTQNTIDSFKNEQAYSGTAANNKFNIDIFYIEDNGLEAQKQAATIKQAIDNKYATLFNVRVRNLPSYINAQPGYRIDASCIRYEKVETKQAEKILGVINDIGVLKPDNIELQPITYRTPNYVSVFIVGK